MIAVNGIQIIPAIFPDKTSQVWKLGEEILGCNNASITWDFDSESEVMHLAQLCLLLKKLRKNISLYINYMPYARQDKEISNDNTFALHAFAQILNGMGIPRIRILDPHSGESLKLIQNSTPIYPVLKVMGTFKKTASSLICYPDNGAFEKYFDHYAERITAIYAEKIRDQSTGAIINLEVIGDAEGHRVLIVDDICDGGATFAILAKELLSKKAKEVNLFVTHGLFTKGLKALKDSGINRIFTDAGEVAEIINKKIIFRPL